MMRFEYNFGIHVFSIVTAHSTSKTQKMTRLNQAQDVDVPKLSRSSSLIRPSTDRVRGWCKVEKMDTSGIEPDPSRKFSLGMLSERDNQLHHVPLECVLRESVFIIFLWGQSRLFLENSGS